jgi:hypothetical protein
LGLRWGKGGTPISFSGGGYRGGGGGGGGWGLAAGVGDAAATAGGRWVVDGAGVAEIKRRRSMGGQEVVELDGGDDKAR